MSLESETGWFGHGLFITFTISALLSASEGPSWKGPPLSEGTPCPSELHTLPFPLSQMEKASH